MCTDLSLFPESLARTLLWFISGFLERDLIDGHIALHNTNLYGTLVRSYSLGCCSQSSVEASGLNLFMYKLFGLVHICCHLGLYTLGHLGLYTLGHLGLYIFVAIWACTVWAIWACTYLLPFGPLHGRQITIIM